MTESHDSRASARFWTKEQDALRQDWSRERVFCNPPFSDQGAFVPLAATAKTAVVFLYGTANHTKYLAANPPSYTCYPPRISFDRPNGMKERVPPYGVQICVWGKITKRQREALQAIGRLNQEVPQPRTDPILRYLLARKSA